MSDIECNVVALQGKAVDPTTPSEGQVLTWDDTLQKWIGKDPQQVTQMQEGLFPLATLQAAGATSSATFNIGGALPSDARLMRTELEVVQVLAGGLLVAASATIQGGSDANGTLLSSLSVLGGTGQFSGDGSNPYCSRGGQQITLDVTLTGATFSALTAGSLTARLFYSVIA